MPTSFDVVGDIMILRSFLRIGEKGESYWAGYSENYHQIKTILKKTKSILESTGHQH